MNRTDRLRPSERQARIEFKETLVRIRNFVLYGMNLDALSIELLTTQEPKSASEALRVEGSVDELEAFIEDNIPTGHFPDLKAIQAWQSHQGLLQADDQDKMFFWMKSKWWNPRQVQMLRSNARA